MYKTKKVQVVFLIVLILFIVIIGSGSLKK